jgi:uncharacterized membrane protein
VNLVEQLLPALAAYPDFHPIVVHFPVALFPVALFVWLLALWRYPQFYAMTRLLITIGLVGGLAAAFTGLFSEAMMESSGGSLVNQHRNYMFVFLGLAFALDILAPNSWQQASRLRRLAFGVILLLLNATLILGADRGALISRRTRVEMDPTPPAASAPPALDVKTAAGGPDR